MSDRDRIIRNVPIPSAFANRLTTADSLKQFGTEPFDLRLGGEECGTFTICHIGSEWNERTRQMDTTVDLKPFE